MGMLFKETENKTEASNNSSIAFSTKTLLLILLVLKQTAIVLIGRYSRTSVPSHELCNVTHLIMMTEAAKFILNLTLEMFRGEGVKAFTEILEDPPNTLKLAIPALLYLLQNSLIYVALENLTAPIFQLLYQSKLLFTALISTYALKKYYTLQQWLCLVSLCIGDAVVMLGEHGEVSDEQNLFLGLISVFISGICSAFAGVYFEIIVKESDPKVTLYMRNVQLAFFSLIVAAAQRSSAESQTFFHGFTIWTWFLVILQATGGLVTSFVLKFLDNVMKGMATGFSVFLSSFFSILFFHTKLNLEFVAGSALILGGTFYFHQHVQLPKQCGSSRFFIFLLSFLLFVAKSRSMNALIFLEHHHDLGSTEKNKVGLQGCAVVFSSGSLLKNEDGATIDSFEHVVRINKATTIGFETYVGNRTTIRVCHLYEGESGISPAQWFSNRNESGVKGITFNLTHEEKAGWHSEWNRLKARTVSEWTMAERSLQDDCDQLMYMHTGYNEDLRCSSGAMTVLWAMKYCTNVVIFGLDHDACYPYHYDTGLPTSTNCSKYPRMSHDLVLEERYIQSLHRKGNLTVNRFME